MTAASTATAPQDPKSDYFGITNSNKYQFRLLGNQETVAAIPENLPETADSTEQTFVTNIKSTKYSLKTYQISSEESVREQWDEIFKRHQALATKEAYDEISEGEIRELVSVRWKIDQIEDDILGSSFRELQKQNNRYDEFSQKIDAILKQISSLVQR